MPRNELEVNAEQRHLAVTQGIYLTASAIGSLFLTLYLFRHGGLAAIAQFYISVYAVLIVAETVGGLLLRRLPTRRLAVSGCAWLAALYLIIVVLSDRCADYPWQLGAMQGVGSGLFWTGLNVSEFVTTHQANRSHYFALVYRWTSIFPAGAQLLAAGVFWLTTGHTSTSAAYNVIFVLLLALYAITSLAALKLPAFTGSRFRVGDIASSRPPRVWQLALIQIFLSGLMDIAVPLLATTLLFISLGNEDQVSTYMGLLAIAAGVAAPRIGTQLHRRPATMWMGVIAVPIGLAVFSYSPVWIAMAAFALGYRIALPYLWIPMRAFNYQAQEAVGGDWRTHYHLFIHREIFLDAGRIVSF